jgi:hypothetical protein
MPPQLIVLIRSQNIYVLTAGIVICFGLSLILFPLVFAGFIAYRLYIRELPPIVKYGLIAIVVIIGCIGQSLWAGYLWRTYYPDVGPILPEETAGT